MNIDMWSKFKGKSVGKNTFEKLIKVLNEKNYILIGDYYRVSDKITVQCDKGHLFSMRCADIIRGASCNKCTNHDVEHAKEKFYKKVEELNYEIIEDYIDSETHVKLKCNNGHEISIKPTKIMAGRKCSICSKNNSEDFKNRLYKVVDELNFEILDIPINSQNPIRFQCDKGHIFKRNPSNFYNKNQKCPICNRGNVKPPLTGDAFASFVEEFGYKLLEPYVNNLTKVKFRCDKGHTYETSPKAFKSGCRCPKCSNTCPEQAKQRFLDICENNNYVILGEYINSKIKVEIKCSKGHIFKMRPNDITMGSKCPKCNNCCPEQSKERFLNNLKKKNYILTGIYTGNMNPVEMQCNMGHTFVRRPNDINNGHGCRVCAQSKIK